MRNLHFRKEVLNMLAKGLDVSSILKAHNVFKIYTHEHILEAECNPTYGLFYKVKVCNCNILTPKFPKISSNNINFEAN